MMETVWSEQARLRFRVGLVSALLFAVLAVQAEVTVSNLVVAQRPGTKLVDISYDVSCTLTNVLSVDLVVSNGTQRVNTSYLTGQVGIGIVAGLQRKITWNMASDWNKNAAWLSFSVIVHEGGTMPIGGDPSASSWIVMSARWVKNIYANNEVTMSNLTTGRMWLYDANLCGKVTWYEATDFCEDLEYGGHSDWLLSSPGELYSHCRYEGSMFAYVQGEYWSNETAEWSNDHAYVVNGNGWESRFKTGLSYVWPMRIIK